ncbi:hypothetical protein ACQ4PT_010245 [Festuca glaucescens]
MSSDIENPPPSPSSSAVDASAGADDAATATATAPEPSRHGFWALKERLVALYFTGNNAQHDGDDNGQHDGNGDGEVATVDADQRSRYIFVHFWSKFFLFLAFVGFLPLLVLPSEFNLGPAWIVTTCLLAVIGISVSLCAGYFTNLRERLDEGDTSVHKVIDSLM